MDQVTELIAQLQETDEFVQRNAMMTLIHIGAPSVPALMTALPALVAALADPDESLIWCIHSVLRRCGTAAIPSLIDGLSSNVAAVRWNATVILGDIGNATAVPALVKILKKDGGLLYYSLWADWAFLRTVAKALSAIAVRDPDPILRSALLFLHRLRNLDPSFEEALYFQDAIDKIETATAATKGLPLPTTAPLLDSQTLPLPAIATTMSPDALPIPTSTIEVGQDPVAKRRRRLIFWGKRR